MTKLFTEMSSEEFRKAVCEIVEKSSTPEQVIGRFREIQYPYMLGIKFREQPMGTKMQDLLIKSGFLLGPGNFMTMLMVWGPNGMLLEFP